MQATHGSGTRRGNEEPDECWTAENGTINSKQLGSKIWANTSQLPLMIAQIRDPVLNFITFPAQWCHTTSYFYSGLLLLFYAITKSLYSLVLCVWVSEYMVVYSVPLHQLHDKHTLHCIQLSFCFQFNYAVLQLCALAWGFEWILAMYVCTCQSSLISVGTLRDIIW